MQALQALATALDARDPYTAGHSERVAFTAGQIAHYFGYSSEMMSNIVTAARMHDIGKIGVPDSILHKRGPLTEAELVVIRSHPDIGADILAAISTLSSVVPMVRAHHEHYDGSGYPRGLRGAEIPLGARVIAVADAIDAMLGARPYKPAYDACSVLAELRVGACGAFDPVVVEAALDLYGPDGLLLTKPPTGCISGEDEGGP